MNQESNQLTPQRIIQFAWSYAVPLAMEAAVKNRVFDALDANGAMSLSQLSEQTDASERGLRALLDMLVSIELLEKRGGAMYALTPESAAFLVSTKPSFQGGIFKHISSQLIPKWMKLSEIVRSGKPEIAVNAEGEGSAFFEQFVEDIFPVSYPAAQTLSEHLKIAVIDAPMKVLDIGSGSGVWGVALAQESRNVRVTAVDWARVIAVTRRIALRHGVADRFTFVEGDILSANFGDVTISPRWVTFCTAKARPAAVS